MTEAKGLLSNAVVLGAGMVVVAAIVLTSVAGSMAAKTLVDNGNGTVTDIATGLMWEKKTGVFDGSNANFCTGPADCPAPTNVNNIYSWSSAGTAPDGTLFTDFIPKLNCSLLHGVGGACGTSDPLTGQVTRYRDWRIPTIAELRSIQIPQGIDPTFGPTAPSIYWSSTSEATALTLAWFVNFQVCTSPCKVTAPAKTNLTYARAVRGGP
jgi:hypothetical protein